MDLAEREKVCKFTKSFSTDDNTAFYYNSRNSPTYASLRASLAKG